MTEQRITVAPNPPITGRHSLIGRDLGPGASVIFFRSLGFKLFMCPDSRNESLSSNVRGFLI